MTKPSHPRVCIPVSEYATIVDRYNNFESAAAIARDYGCAQPTITRILKRNGANMRNGMMVTNLVDGTKRCPRCKTIKRLEDFYLSANGRRGATSSYCIPCHADYGKENLAKQTPEERERRRTNQNTYKRQWNANNPEKGQDYALRYGVGITLETMRAQTLAQDGRCAICGQLPSTGRWKTLYADHDHATGVFRGMLCDVHNKGLGYFGDDVELLQRAIEYLLAPPASTSTKDE